MDHLGLHHNDYRKYLETLLTPGHRRMIRMHVLDLANGKHLRDLTSKVIDGQVVYDVTSDVSRMLDIDFFDEHDNILFDPDDPSAAPIHRSRVVRVFDSRYVEALGDWVDCPVFTGPVWDFQRDSGVVTLTAHGMERQALSAAWDVQHFPKKTKLTNAIRDLLAAAGDVNAQVPDLPHTFPHDLTVHPLDDIWPHVKRLCKSLDRRCFYDGMGRFKMPPFTQKPVYNFHHALTSRVVPKRTVDGFTNTVVVLGPNPKGPKKRIRAAAFIKGPLSPGALNRNGVPLHLVFSDEIDAVNKRVRDPKHPKKKKAVVLDYAKTQKQAQQVADRLALEHGTTRNDLSFTTVPLPMLEEHDMTAVTDDSFGTARLRLMQWDLPLEGGEAGGSEGSPATIGSNRRTKKVKVRR